MMTQTSGYALARTATNARLARPSTLTPMQAIAILEDGGYITPRCPECSYLYKDAITVRDRMVENARWRPSTSHVASPDCLRDRQPHCPCGVCTGRRG